MACNKRVHFLYLSLIIFILFHPFILFSQDDNAGAWQAGQDSILTEITDLSSALRRDNELNYVLSDTAGGMLRYYQDLINDYLDYPHSYMDIIRNPRYDTLGYVVTLKDTMIVDPSFMPVVFTGKIVPDPVFPIENTNPFSKYSYPIKGLDTVRLFEKELFDQKLRDQAYDYFTSHYPDHVEYMVSDLPETREKPETIQVNVFRDLFQVENNPDFSQATGPDKLFVPERKYWEYRVENTMQFSHNFISTNWYKGGNNNLNIVSDHKGIVTYAKDRVKFSSELRWNLSLYTNSSDSRHKIKTGVDEIRSYTDFGLQAFNQKWYYSTNLEAKTQAFIVYDGETDVKQSSFASPLFVNMGILGMKYSHSYTSEKNKARKYSINADISPLSVNYIYVADKDVDPTRHKIEEGKRHKTDIGSKINSTFSLNFSQQISLTSRFMYFTNYSRVEAELENTLDMSINRYLSARFYLYLRFDDDPSRPHEKNLKHLQVNEIISFGIKYKWGGIR